MYLIDGTPSGIRTVEVSNRTIRFTVFNRGQIDKFAKRHEAQKPGNYILIGSDFDSEKERIYIGECEDLYARLGQHLSDDSKNFWTNTIVISSVDDNLTKGHILYLEKVLIGKAKKASRCILDNSNAGRNTRLPEIEIAAADEIIELIMTVLPILGCSVFHEITNIKDENDSEKFELRIRDIEANAVEIDGNFIVRKNSKAAKEELPACRQGYAKIRQNLIADGILVTEGKFLRFTKDHQFQSVTSAASVIAGGNTNGKIAWKNLSSNRTYGEWEVAKAKNMVDAIDDEDS
jgi:hypothetical protein